MVIVAGWRSMVWGVRVCRHWRAMWWSEEGMGGARGSGVVVVVEVVDFWWAWDWLRGDGNGGCRLKVVVMRVFKG